MVEGDIDLTENLDFYREKMTFADKLAKLRRFKSKLPWAGKEYKPFAEKHWLNQVLGDLLDSNKYWYTANGNSVTWHQFSNSSSYELTLDTGMMTYSLDTNYSTIEPSTTSGLSNVYWTYNTWTTNDNTYAMNTVLNYISSSTDDIIDEQYDYVGGFRSGYIEYKEPFKIGLDRPRFFHALDGVLTVNKCDECGKKFIYIKNRYLGTRCRDCNKVYMKEKRHDDAFLMIIRHKKSFEQRQIDKYGFDNTYIDFSEYHRPELRSAYKRKQAIERIGWMGHEAKDRPIPWLQKLSYRAYREYMESIEEGEEQDHLEYLTNMNWIGVRKTHHV